MLKLSKKGNFLNFLLKISFIPFNIQKISRVTLLIVHFHVYNIKMRVGKDENRIFYYVYFSLYHS